MPLTDAQRAERRLGIGGSDAAAVCGRHPKKSPLSVWMEKAHGITTERSGEAAEWGNLFEPIIAKVAAERLGMSLQVPTQTIVHPKWPWQRSNLDGVLDGREVLEIKCLNAIAAKELGPAGTDLILRWHFYQVHHYLATTGMEVAHIAYLVGGNDLRLFRLEYDRELAEMLTEREHEFWRDRVEAKDAPMEGASFEDMEQYIAWKYPLPQRQTLEIDESHPGVMESLNELASAKAEAKAAEGRLTRAQQEVQLIMGGATDLVCPLGKVLWRPDRRGTRTFKTYLNAQQGEESINE